MSDHELEEMVEANRQALLDSLSAEQLVGLLEQRVHDDEILALDAVRTILKQFVSFDDLCEVYPDEPAFDDHDDTNETYDEFVALCARMVHGDETAFKDARDELRRRNVNGPTAAQMEHLL